jgi:hypothetical protein
MWTVFRCLKALIVTVVSIKVGEITYRFVPIGILLLELLL